MSVSQMIHTIFLFWYAVSVLSFLSYPLQLVLRSGNGASLYAEDGLIETLSMLIFLSAACVSMVGFLKYQRVNKRWISLFIFAVSLVSFLDEISFGKRIFDWSAVQINGIFIDGAHDYITMYAQYLKNTYSMKQFLPVAAVLVAIGGIVLYILRTRIWQIITSSKVFPFLACAFCTVAAASFLDLEFFFYSDMAVAVEETLELCAGWALFSAAFVRLVEVSSFARDDQQESRQSCIRS